MKRLKRFVTVNSGEHEGKRGQLVSYDRNKYYGVKLEGVKEVVEFKLYYLDLDRPLKKNQRFLLPPRYDLQYTNKELWECYKEGKNNLSTKFRTFTIHLIDEEASCSDLNLQELKTKIRYCIQNNKSFFIRQILYHNGWGFTSSTVCIFNSENDTYEFCYYSERDIYVLSSVERNITKIFNSYL